MCSYWSAYHEIIIPATRKAGEFVGHNASKACSCCLKDFHQIDDHVDCLGFNRDPWTVRYHSLHCIQAHKTLTVFST